MYVYLYEIWRERERESERASERARERKLDRKKERQQARKKEGTKIEVRLQSSRDKTSHAQRMPRVPVGLHSLLLGRSR